MAARTARPTRPTTEGKKLNSSNLSKHNDFWQSLRTFLHSQQCQLIVGILLLFIALMLLISYISFFFTGANDMSIIQENATRSTLRNGITNALGLPGAVIASWLIDSTEALIHENISLSSVNTENLICASCADWPLETLM